MGGGGCNRAGSFMMNLIAARVKREKSKEGRPTTMNSRVEEVSENVPRGTASHRHPHLAL